jgi:hypothetical protein
VFLHFDKDRSNSLGETEFGAALASLGLNYEPEEMEEIIYSLSNGKGRVNFEQFIRFMVRVPFPSTVLRCCLFFVCFVVDFGFMRPLGYVIFG